MAQMGELEFLAPQGESEDRQESQQDAKKDDLRGRNQLERPFHENKIAAPDQAEQPECDISVVFHFAHPFGNVSIVRRRFEAVLYKIAVRLSG